MKTCRTCLTNKPEADFHKDRSKKDGVAVKCKKCAIAHSLLYRTSNAEIVRKRKAERYAANPDQAKAYSAAYELKNMARIAVRKAIYRASNQELVKKGKSAWYSSNPDARRIHEHNRRARIRSAGGKLSLGLSVKLFEDQHGLCACCGEMLGDDFHMDHIMPLALGGLNIDDNIQLLRAICNMRKGSKHPSSFGSIGVFNGDESRGETRPDQQPSIFELLGADSVPRRVDGCRETQGG